VAPDAGGGRVLGGAFAKIGRPAESGHSHAMPNIQQQEKRVGIAARQRLENLRYRSTIKTLAKRLENAVAEGDADAAAAEHQALVRTIDKAAAHGAIHKNTAARRKAQAARMITGA
jgi:small subunit ribosomal protein S20